jgi:L-threonylcarbamoyladenylate synthase
LLLDQTGIPIAAPSANLAGRISPTSAEACVAELRGKIPVVLDGGPCPVGIESTVIGFDNGSPVLLRPGAITREELEKITGPLSAPLQTSISAPGMLASHYAPRARLCLNAGHADRSDALLAFGTPFPTHARHVCNLSPAGDLREAAANLFAMLRRLDDTGVPLIAVMPIPATGLGEAINDRLTRAAAPRA